MILTTKIAPTKNKIKQVFFFLLLVHLLTCTTTNIQFKKKKKLTKRLTTFLFGVHQDYNTNYSDSMIAQFYFHNDKDVLNRISRYFIWSLKEAPSVRNVSQEKRYVLTLYKNE